MREERRLRVFENRVLRKIFGPKRDGITVGCRRLRIEELNDLYCSPNIHYSDEQIEMNEMGWTCCTYWGEERSIQGFGWET
jgi:hypothetical protein